MPEILMFLNEELLIFIKEWIKITTLKGFYLVCNTCCLIQLAMMKNKIKDSARITLTDAICIQILLYPLLNIFTLLERECRLHKIYNQMEIFTFYHCCHIRNHISSLLLQHDIVQDASIIIYNISCSHFYVVTFIWAIDCFLIINSYLILIPHNHNNTYNVLCGLPAMERIHLTVEI